MSAEKLSTNEWKLYIRKEPFFAMHVKEDMTFKDKQGNVFYAKKGYYICRTKDNSTIWVISSKLLHTIYKKLIPSLNTKQTKWIPYIDKEPIEAVQLKTDFILNQRDKKIQGNRNDYLCRNLNKTKMWVVSENIFTTTYKSYNM